MRNLAFLAAVVLVLALLIFCIFRHGARRGVKAAGIMAAVMAAVTLVGVWSFPRWKHPKTTGEFEVSEVSCTYIDENRIETYEDDGSARWLSVGFWYPENYTGVNHTCPLVVFSHGSFGKKESNAFLYRELASHGYVVCAIDHTYQSLSATGPDGEKTGLSARFRKQIMTAGDSSPEKREALLGSFTEWMAIRTGDISFVLDTIIARSRAGDGGENGVYLLVDTRNIGVMGHSLGGAAALGIGRTRSDVKAVIALEAPFMCDVQGIQSGDFVWDSAAYPVPLLSVYTDSTWSKLGKSPQYAQNAAVCSDDCDTTRELYVKGAGHMTLTDLAYSMPTLCLLFGQDMFLDVDENTSMLNQAYLAFFDDYLKSSDGAAQPVQ